MKKSDSKIIVSVIALFIVVCVCCLVCALLAGLGLVVKKIRDSALQNTELLDPHGIPMVFVPSGLFIFGSDEYESDEAPSSEYDLNAFYIDKYEVTNFAYQECVDEDVCLAAEESHSFYNDRANNNGYGPDFSNYPVVLVDWYMAMKYCSWRGGVLPTEVQWEKAARGTDGRVYPWEALTLNPEFANYGGYFPGPVQVGSYEKGKSVYGVYDMAGNAREWVSSLYKPYPYDPRDGREDTQSVEPRVQRGGAWSILNPYMRTSDRTYYEPESKDYFVGFRCASNITDHLTFNYAE